MADIEIIDRFDQPDAAHLEKVVRVFAAVRKPLDHAEHKAQVSPDELIPRRLVSFLHPPEENRFLRLGEDLELRRIHAAELHFIILQASTPLTPFFSLEVWV